MEEQTQPEYHPETDSENQGHLDSALHHAQLTEFEEEIELYRTYGGD